MPRKGENIYKRKDGRWEGRYIKARSKTGKAVYGYVYAPTYKEAKRKRSQAIINIEANQTTICKVPETTMPTCFIRKLANDWMNSIQSQIKKSSYTYRFNMLILVLTNCTSDSKWFCSESVQSGNLPQYDKLRNIGGFISNHYF